MSNLYLDIENKLRLDGGAAKQSRMARKEANLKKDSSMNSTLNASKLNNSKQGTNRSRSASKSPSRGTGGDRFLPRLATDSYSALAGGDLLNMSSQIPVDRSERDLVETVKDVAATSSQGGILSYCNKPKMMPGSGHGNKLVFSATKSTRAKTSVRYVDTGVDRILDAPGVEDDFNLNLLDWGANNILAVALANQIFLWNAETSSIKELVELDDGCKVTSVRWIDDCNLAFGDSSNRTHVWDAIDAKSLRKLRGHAARVASIAVGQKESPWLLTCGSQSGEIHNYDVRKPNPFLSKYNMHTEEVSGLNWSPDGRYLASGGIDNIVGIWSNDIGATVNGPMHQLTDHQAGVKAVQWCPWKPQLLATGGGTACQKMMLWNGNTGQKMLHINTANQISGIHWNAPLREIITCHGYPNNVLKLWKYPKFSHIIDFEGHDGRIISSSQSPCGEFICTVGEDETLRIWKAFHTTETNSKSKSASQGRPGAATALSMRF